MAEVSPEEKLLNVIKNAQTKMRLKKELRLFTKVNIVLTILIVAILAVFLLDVFTFNYNTPELSVNLPEDELEVSPVAEPFQDDEEYIDVNVEKDKDVSISKEDLAKELNLLGIIEGDNNQAIIEDTKAKKTFFLYKGDSIGEFKVYDIKEGSVLLEYRGEKVELKI